MREEVLQGIRFGVTQAIPKNTYPQHLQFDEFDDYSKGYFIRQLQWTLFGKKIEERKYPSTWWDAFKDRWFPKFMRDWFPVNFDHFQLYNICPHLAFAWKDQSDLHLTWITENHGFDTFQSSPTTARKEE